MTAPTLDHISDAASIAERWSNANISAVLKLWSFDADEERKLRQVQTLIADVPHWKNDPYEVAGYLFDFRDWTAAEIARLFRRMVDWRIAERMDTYCERYTPPPEMAYYPAFLLRDLDRDGDPVYVIRIGAWDAWDMHQRLGPDAIVDYSHFLQELVGTRRLRGVPPEWNWQTGFFERQSGGRRYHQFTMVVDLHGLNWSQHLKPALRTVLAPISRVSQDYYPGTTKRIVLLRAPSLFKMAWSMVKQWIDPQMQQLITVTTSSDYLQVWDKYMTPESLPACMHPNGGRGRPMPGYWEHVCMEGGPIPEMLDSRRQPCRAIEPSRSGQEDVTTKSISLFKGYVGHDNRVAIDRQ